MNQQSQSSHDMNLQEASFYVPWDDNNFFSEETQNFDNNVDTCLQKLEKVSEEILESPAFCISKPTLRQCTDKLKLYRETKENVAENVLKWTEDAELLYNEKTDIEKQILNFRNKKDSLRQQIAELKKKSESYKNNFKIKKHAVKVAEKKFRDFLGMEVEANTISSNLFAVTLKYDINGRKYEVKFTHDVNLNRITDFKLDPTLSFTGEEEEMLNQHILRKNIIGNVGLISLIRKLLIEKSK